MAVYIPAGKFIVGVLATFLSDRNPAIKNDPAKISMAMIVDSNTVIFIDKLYVKERTNNTQCCYCTKQSEQTKPNHNHAGSFEEKRSMLGMSKGS